MTFFHVGFGGLDYFRKLASNVIALSDVSIEVIELDTPGEHGLANSFPFAKADSLLAVALVELLGFLLIGALAESSRNEVL